MNVSEIFRTRKTKGQLGLEVELVGRGFSEDEEGVWDTHADGSLQGNGIEYVLARPCMYKDLPKKIDRLKKVVSNSTIKKSIKAGVHVHVNCQDMNILELYTFISSYLLLENVLMRFCGEGREGNLFCLRSCDAEYLTNVLISAATTKKPREHFLTDRIRYASMNLNALGKFGSLEFRGMRSDGDFEGLQRWCKVLWSLKENSKRFPTPGHLLANYSYYGSDSLMEDLLGESCVYFKAIPIEDRRFLLDSAVRSSVRDIVHCVDWDTHFVKNSRKTKNPFLAAKSEEDNEEVHI